jgi:KOW motif-containing protein
MPLRLTREDFDAFAPGSAAVRARLELAPRMLRWARGVARRLEEHGVEVRAVAPGFGAGPRKGKGELAQRVLLQEDPEGGKVAETGVRLSLCLHGGGVEVALEIPALAKAGPARLRDALADDAFRAELLAAFEALPEPFAMSFAGESSAASASSGPSARLSLLERGVTTGRPIKLAWTVPRDVALAQFGLLDGELEDGVLALLPTYKLIMHPEAEGRGGRTRGKPGPKSRRPRLTRATRTRAEDMHPPFERGAKVRVLAGPFAGKVGVVKEVDATSGRAQVMLGLLATRIDVKDLSASTGGVRPTLSSSHRKPLGLR